MRHQRYFVCFETGRAFAVVKGATAARQLLGGRRHYISFPTRLAAEDYAAWWNHENLPWWHQPSSHTWSPPKGRTAS